VRNPAINAALEITISQERLVKYLLSANNDLDAAIALYEKNMRLAQSFYAPLQCLEICLRNKLHVAMTAAYGVDWFDNGNAPLDQDAKREILEAYRNLDEKPEPQPGDLIAELRFGFWVSLLGPRYDATLWRRALNQAFRAKAGKPRKAVHGRLNALRRFRNRVFHHEPIFHRPLEELHNELLEAIGWMDEPTRAWTEHHSQFPAVFAAG
jgi:hypothetical protein